MPWWWRAILVGLVLGAVGAWFGVFVVQRRMAFLGTGLAHAAFAGVALGLLLGSTQPLLYAYPIAAVAAIAIVWAERRTRLANDTVIGVVFATTMALGIVFLARSGNYTRDAMTWLFGSVLALETSDCYAALGLLGLALLSAPLWPRWAYASFDRELATVDRLPVTRDDLILILAIATTVVTAVRLVGVVLVTAFLVIPPAAARLVSLRFVSMTVYALVLGVTSVLAGLLLSHAVDLPSGPCIVLVQAGLFGCAALVQRCTRV